MLTKRQQFEQQHAAILARTHLSFGATAIPEIYQRNKSGDYKRPEIQVDWMQWMHQDFEGIMRQAIPALESSALGMLCNGTYADTDIHNQWEGYHTQYNSEQPMTNQRTDFQAAYLKALGQVSRWVHDPLFNFHGSTYSDNKVQAAWVMYQSLTLTDSERADIPPIGVAFKLEMKGCQYDDDAYRQAMQWFRLGWKRKIMQDGVLPVLNYGKFGSTDLSAFKSYPTVADAMRQVGAFFSGNNNSCPTFYDTDHLGRFILAMQGIPQSESANNHTWVARAIALTTDDKRNPEHLNTSGENVHNFRTHRLAWRQALVIARDIPGSVDKAGEYDYWQHEIDAYDITFCELLGAVYSKPSADQIDSALAPFISLPQEVINNAERFAIEDDRIRDKSLMVFNMAGLIDMMHVIVPRLAPLYAAPDINGWIVANGDETAFRTWEDGLPTWTPNRDKATRYARRCDADSAHAEDIDAWKILPYVTTMQSVIMINDDAEFKKHRVVWRSCIDALRVFGLTNTTMGDIWLPELEAFDRILGVEK